MLKERILFLAIGQGAGNIVKELDELDYNCFYINTSYEDLRTLEVNENKIYHIPNSKGCAKSKEKALEYASDYFNEISDILDSKFPTLDIIFVVYGAGGGTSSMSNMLTHIMSAKNPDKIYNIITALPNKRESILVHSNAIENLKELQNLHDEQDNVRSLFLLDNNKRDDFLEVNTEFAMLLDRLIGYNGTTIRGNVDGEEIETLITDKGVNVILEFEEDDFKVGMAKAIKGSIFAEWNADCNYIGAILNKGYTNINMTEEIKEYFGIPITDFTTFDDENGSIVIATGMSFNKSIINSLSEIANERLEQKKKQMEVDLNKEENENTSVDLSSFGRRSSTKKQANKKSSNKDLLSILDKYRNIK